MAHGLTGTWAGGTPGADGSSARSPGSAQRGGPGRGVGPGGQWEWTVDWPSCQPEWLTSRKRVSRGGGPVGQCWLMSTGGEREPSGGSGRPQSALWCCRQECPGGAGLWGCSRGGGQVQAALASRPPAPTAVVLGRVPVSALKSAPPARACPGPGSREPGQTLGSWKCRPSCREPSVAGGGCGGDRPEGRCGCTGTRGAAARRVGAAARPGGAMAASESWSHPLHSTWPRLTCASLSFLICKTGLQRGHTRTGRRETRAGLLVHAGARRPGSGPGWTLPASVFPPDEWTHPLSPPHKLPCGLRGLRSVHCQDSATLGVMEPQLSSVYLRGASGEPGQTPPRAVGVRTRPGSADAAWT